MTWSYNFAGNVCRCPTPRGVRKEWGWDTSTHGEGLKRPQTGGSFFVPPVRPLDAFDTGVRARAPVGSGSRGGTPRTKSEPVVIGRERRCTVGRVSHPCNPACRTPPECPTPRGGV